MYGMEDAVLSANSMIEFPVNVGLTAECFKNNNKVLCINQFTPNSNMNYSKDIDNFQSLKVINNVAFFGVTRDNGTTNGIV